MKSTIYKSKAQPWGPKWPHAVYANLFMGKLEEEKLTKLGNPHILIWKRFIDDIFLIWTGSKTDFETYMNELNKLHHSIKFTYEISQNKLTFLDVTLYKGSRFENNHILDICTHIKPTNKQLYVHASSYHPQSTIAAITKGETKRYLRTNSNEENFKRMTLNLTHRLKERGYKHNQILKHIKSIKFNQRTESLSRKKQRENKIQKLVFVTQFCDDTTRLKRILKKHWKLIQHNNTLRNIFPNSPP